MATIERKLIITALALAKYQFMARFTTEVSGMALTDKNNPLKITDLKLIKQTCSSATTRFDDDAYAEYLEDMAAERGGDGTYHDRIWWHTHPVMSANPSGVDESTFADALGKKPWAVMLILSKTNDRYARLRNRSVGLIPFHDVILPIEEDWSDWKDDVLQVSELAFQWKEEHDRCVSEQSYTFPTPYAGASGRSDYGDHAYRGPYSGEPTRPTGRHAGAVQVYAGGSWQYLDNLRRTQAGAKLTDDGLFRQIVGMGPRPPRALSKKERKRLERAARKEAQSEEMEKYLDAVERIEQVTDDTEYRRQVQETLGVDLMPGQRLDKEWTRERLISEEVSDDVT